MRWRSGRVHPRVCGGAVRLSDGTVLSWGPSPRVRGSLAITRFADPDVGSIPACAGEPSGVVSFISRSKVHPRVCGGAEISVNYPDVPGGPSPRVRGSPRSIQPSSISTGSIPACAGEPSPPPPPPPETEVHPRVCGGAFCDLIGELIESGPSPRVRGSRRDIPGAAAWHGSIPACAGEP